MADTIGSKWIGQTLVTIGLAVASAVGVFILQFGAMEARLSEVERYVNQPHPSRDYRDLIEGQIDRNTERLDRHENLYH